MFALSDKNYYLTPIAVSVTIICVIKPTHVPLFTYMYSDSTMHLLAQVLSPILTVLCLLLSQGEEPGARNTVFNNITESTKWRQRNKNLINF